jgi:hypothetical protein
MRRCGTQVQEEQHAGVPLRRVRAIEGAGRLFFTPSSRPRAANGPMALDPRADRT